MGKVKFMKSKLMQLLPGTWKPQSTGGTKNHFLIHLICAWIGAVTAQAASSGGVVAWGTDIYGQLTIPIAAQSGVTAIASADYHAVALKSDGSVVAWGDNTYGQSTVPVEAQSGVIGI